MDRCYVHKFEGLQKTPKGRLSVVDHSITIEFSTTDPIIKVAQSKENPLIRRLP